MIESSTPTRLLKIGAVCDLTQMSRSAIYREIDSGNLRAVRIGRSVRISENELNRYLRALSASSIEVA